MNHRPLGYEANRIIDSISFQRLDGAGNDTKSLKRLKSTVIGPQSDHACSPSQFTPTAEHKRRDSEERSCKAKGQKHPWHLNPFMNAGVNKPLKPYPLTARAMVRVSTPFHVSFADDVCIIGRRVQVLRLSLAE